jgi:hypothetical protein
MMAKVTDHFWSFDGFYETVIQYNLGWFSPVALARLFRAR